MWGSGMLFVLFLHMWSEDNEFLERARESTYLDAIICYTVPFRTLYPIYSTPDLFCSILFLGTSTYGTPNPCRSILFWMLLFCSWDISSLRQENSK